MIPIYPLIAAGVLYTAGDLFLAGWARSSATIYLAVGLLLNLVGIYIYANTLRFESLGIATAVLLGLNIFAVTVVGAVMFGENLTIMRSLGLVILVSGIVFVELAG